MIDFDFNDPIVEPIIKKYLLKTSFKDFEDLLINDYKIMSCGIILSLKVIGLQPTIINYFLNDSFFEENVIPEIRERKLKQLLNE